MSALAGRQALVTGGGTGIGAAVATALAQAGAGVTICGRRLAPLQAVAAGEANIHAVPADVTCEEAVTKLYRHADDTGRPFDIVVANAGMAESAPASKTSLELWSRTIAVNLTGAFLTVRPALAAMRVRGWGRIVFVASTAGLKGYPYVAPYVAAKHGVVGLMRALALETATAGITVNAVCPGFTDTAMLSDAVERIAKTIQCSEAEARASLAGKNPQGRFIRPREVADAVLWLCSDASASITGQAISVSGGETW
ncbi:MAG: SDR family oxidoreductase [Xanthobacteraceae bacterium]|nr:SDR family oxidoreductase [Xanthobacteraceae bacterium]